MGSSVVRREKNADLLGTFLEATLPTSFFCFAIHPLVPVANIYSSSQTPVKSILAHQHLAAYVSSLPRLLPALRARAKIRRHNTERRANVKTVHSMHLMYIPDPANPSKRIYTLKKVIDGEVSKSAHPARFSPDDKYSRHRVTIKKRYGLLLTQQSMFFFSL